VATQRGAPDSTSPAVLAPEHFFDWSRARFRASGKKTWSVRRCCQRHYPTTAAFCWVTRVMLVSAWPTCETPVLSSALTTRVLPSTAVTCLIALCSYVHGRTGLNNQGAAFIHTRHAGADKNLDLVGSIGTASGESANLADHDHPLKVWSLVKSRGGSGGSNLDPHFDPALLQQRQANSTQTAFA
jgi:hypothetical protein